ncbi:MAG: BspA family leucine-rich repeat surface protein [Oscillospiraceae bacterium]|nr:BspA family leucine-rich repeat surface protein [Oscillospiraceae bacterium]
MDKKKLLSFVTALAMSASFSAPAFAEAETDIALPVAELPMAEVTGDVPEDAAVTDADITDTAEVDDTSDKAEGDEITDALPADEADTAESAESEDEFTEESGEIPDTAPDTEDTAAETAEDAGSTADDTLTEDEEEYLIGSWFTFNSSTGTLTLKDQLPDCNATESSFRNIIMVINSSASLNISNESVKKIIILSGTKTGEIAGGMFANLPNLESITSLNNLDTSSATNMGYMFYKCPKLTSLDLSSFDTSNVTNMINMFTSCSGLTALDLSSFDTSKVKNMGMMFNSCTALKTITVSKKWTTSALTTSYSSGMFRDCINLVGGAGTVYDSNYFGTQRARIDGGASAPGYLTSNLPAWIQSWDEESGTLTLRGQLPETAFGNTLAMQAGIDQSAVRKIVISSGTKAGTSAAAMFYDMEALTEFEGLENLDTSSVTNMRFMFFNCPLLTSLDLTGFDTSKVTTMNNMFKYCSGLKTITVSDKWTTAAVTTSLDMFGECTSLRGSAGTVYNSSHTDHTYARIDGGASNPGYLTSIHFPNG